MHLLVLPLTANSARKSNVQKPPPADLGRNPAPQGIHRRPMIATHTEISRLRSNGIIDDADVRNHAYKAAHPGWFRYGKRLTRLKNRYERQADKRLSEAARLAAWTLAVLTGRDRDMFPSGFLAWLFLPITAGLFLWYTSAGVVAAGTGQLLRAVRWPFQHHRESFDRSHPTTSSS